jgi:hypothetical protein
MFLPYHLYTSIVLAFMLRHLVCLQIVVVVSCGIRKAGLCANYGASTVVKLPTFDLSDAFAVFILAMMQPSAQNAKTGVALREFDLE